MTEPNNLSIGKDTEPESTPRVLDNMEPQNQAVGNVATEYRSTPGTTSGRTSLFDLPQEVRENSNSYYLAKPRNLTAITHTNSMTWAAPIMAEQEKFAAVMENLARTEFIPRSPFVPTNLSEWLDHRVAFTEDIRREEMRKLINRETSHGSNAGTGRVRIGPAFGGKRFCDNRSSVLAMRSIWSPWYQPTEAHPQALWPSPEEMKIEGDKRHTSGFRRFLALPRVPGNETLVWHQKHMITPFPFDRIWQLPTLEEEKEEDDEPAMEELIGESLLKDLDP